MPARLWWKLRRLQAMSPPEIMYRAASELTAPSRRRIAQRRCLVTGIYASIPENSDPEEMSSYCIELNDEDAAAFRRMPTLTATLCSRVEMVMAGRFPLLGLGYLELGEIPDWHRDPQTSHKWRMEYAPDIDYRHNAPGEIRLLWEVNRLHAVMWLAEASFIFQNVDYARRASILFNDWILNNPVDLGPNWVSPMECALRVHSWIWTYSFLVWTNESAIIKSRRDLLSAIFQHIAYIYRHRARFSSANNHLIVEAGTLAVAGLFFDNVKGDQWLQLGLKILVRELPRQVYPDGVDAEQALHYHGFVLEMLLLVIAFAKRRKKKLPAVLVETARHMTSFLTTVVDDRGGAPHIGDSDDGLVIAFAPEPELVYRRLIGLAGVLFSDPAWLHMAGEINELTFWIAGSSVACDAYKTIPFVDNNQTRESRFFPDGGYLVMRTQDDVTGILDCGPLGYGALAAHGHSDCLSMTIRVAGNDILADPGTYIYNTEKYWRDYFRRTSVHNTVNISEENQSEMLGPFLWGRKAISAVHGVGMNHFCDCIQVSHDGYRNWRHRRTVVFLKTALLWVIYDELIPVNDKGSNMAAKAQITWQLGKDVTAENICSENRFCMYELMNLAGGRWRLALHHMEDVSLECSLGDGMISERFLLMRQAPKISGEAPTKDFKVLTVLAPADALPKWPPEMSDGYHKFTCGHRTGLIRTETSSKRNSVNDSAFLGGLLEENGTITGCCFGAQHFSTPDFKNYIVGGDCLGNASLFAAKI